jgi:hypothetical protein
MRRIVITVIVLVVVAGLTASSALANSPHLKKGREQSCVIAGSAIGCRDVVPRLARSAGVSENGNDGGSLPYDEFGLSANQPSQPRVGGDGTQTRRDAAGLTAPTSAPDNSDVNNNDGNALPYDEFGLAANQPNQPRLGGDGTQTRRG